VKLYSGNAMMRISMTPTTWDTERGFDNLKIYDGQSTVGALLSTLSGPTLPGTIHSSGSYLYLKVGLYDPTTGREGAWRRPGSRCGDSESGSARSSSYHPTPLNHTQL
jgi:hypothetical protein